MRTYALKTRVDNGPGNIALEISMARALHVRRCPAMDVCACGYVDV
jgi:hypothetical protein